MPVSLAAVGLALALVAPPDPPAAPAAPDPAVVLFRNHAGEELRLRDLRGRVVMLEFFSPECLEVEPLLALADDLAARYGGEVALLAVGVDDDLAALAPLAGRPARGLRLLLDPGGELASSLGVRELPSVLLLDREGRSRRLLAPTGPAGWAEVSRSLERLVAER